MSVDDDYKVLRWVLETETIPGWALEFGVASGTSLCIIAEHMPVIGFDSFEGLPEDWREGFPKGTFAGVLPTVPAYGHNVMIQHGLFAETIPALAETTGLPPIGLIHVDCDLYTSTWQVLDGLAEHIQPGVIIVFDEYHGYGGWEDHEALAWAEFTAEYGVAYEPLEFPLGTQAVAFRVVEG